MLETDGMRLQLYQNMLTNISTQATLLLGFALATYGADLLPYILNDTSPFCVFKTASHGFVGALFLLANTCCICFCLLVLIFSSYLIVKSQDAYLHVGGNAAVWRTSELSWSVYFWYGGALACFMLDAVLLMWIFLGLPHWVNAPNAPSNTSESDSLTTWGGRDIITCLDPHDDSAHEMRDSYGQWQAVLSTVFFAGFTFYGYEKWSAFQRAYALDAIHGSAGVAREEQRERVKRQLKTEVYHAELRLGDATKALRNARRKRLSTVEMKRYQRQAELAESKLAAAVRQNADQPPSRRLLYFWQRQQRQITKLHQTSAGEVIGGATLGKVMGGATIGKSQHQNKPPSASPASPWSKQRLCAPAVALPPAAAGAPHATWKAAKASSAKAALSSSSSTTAMPPPPPLPPSPPLESMLGSTGAAVDAEVDSTA